MRRFLNKGRGALVALVVAGASAASGCQGQVAGGPQPTAASPKADGSKTVVASPKTDAARYWVASYDTTPDSASSLAAGRPQEARAAMVTKEANAAAGQALPASAAAMVRLPSDVADVSTRSIAHLADAQPGDKVNHLRAQPIASAGAAGLARSTEAPARNGVNASNQALDSGGVAASAHIEAWHVTNSNSPADVQRLSLPQ